MRDADYIEMQERKIGLLGEEAFKYGFSEAMSYKGAGICSFIAATVEMADLFRGSHDNIGVTIGFAGATALLCVSAIASRLKRKSIQKEIQSLRECIDKEKEFRAGQPTQEGPKR